MLGLGSFDMFISSCPGLSVEQGTDRKSVV